MAALPSRAAAGADLLFLREERLRFAQALMFLAQRDMAEAVAPMLEEDGLGRAQYRVMQVLAFSPGMPVSRVQDILGVTKQSLGRTLHELEERQYLEIRRGREDRRLRLLFLTQAGQDAEARLFAVVRQKLMAAYREAGGAAVEGFGRVMRGMLSEHSRSVLADEGKIDVGRQHGG
ncbi:MarR family winged helix-turn-helix transcriptional regulator [Acetobacter papayae]|uniref:MarR family winged helix-turn-helix transcriptional regulator n=1 Tax=Acetobacter papayae TaxID=1076592 RepID=UPI0039E82BF4